MTPIQGIPLSKTESIKGVLWSLLLFVLFTVFRAAQLKKQTPLINGKRLFDLSGHGVRKAFTTQLPELLQAGLQKADVFRLQTPTGVRFVISPKMAHEISTHPKLSPYQFMRTSLCTDISGFEVLKESETRVVRDAVRLRLTRQMAKLTKHMSMETASLLEAEWTCDSEWHEVTPSVTALRLTSQLTSMVFVGDEIGRSTEWLDTVVSYSSEVLPATQELNMWPWLLRPLVAHYSSTCQRLRLSIKRARAILLPVIQQRYAADKAGVPGKFDDAIEWLNDVAHGRSFDPVLSQMVLAVGSIHTSSDLLAQVLLDICQYEDADALVHELRNEIVTALGLAGWQKIGLNNLKLLDSVLKETQRMKPASLSMLGRTASQTINLSDGTTIPAGSHLFVANLALRDPTIYPNPDKFDPYRFAKLRAAGNKSAYLVSPSPEHLGFGLGEHACPGRFFAAHEIKIILCHILLKYDMKMVGSCQASPQNLGVLFSSAASARIAVRRRQDDMAL